MTSIREALRQLLQRKAKARADAHDSEFSFAVHWTMLAREWDATRRQRIQSVVRVVTTQPEFIANEFERRYSIDEIGAGKHSGASLVALERVLASFTTEKDQEE